MSHEIRQHDIQEGREMAWHGLTKVNPELAIPNCWLNTWDYKPKVLTVDGKPSGFMTLGVTDEAMVPAMDENGSETTDLRPLQIGRPYSPASFKPVLNSQLLEKLSKAIEGQGLTLESAGTVMNRARLFLSFGLKEAKFQAAGRPFVAFLNIGNGQDMSSPFWINTSNVCTVCNNTFTMNMNDAGFIMSVKKTKFSELKIQNLDKAISAMLKGQKDFAQFITDLSQVECAESIAREFFAGFVCEGDVENPLSTRSLNTIDRLVALFNKGAGNDGNDYSDVFQALTDYYTHEAASSQKGNDAKWKNFVSSEFGSGRKAKSAAYDILLDTELRKSTVTIGKKALAVTAKAERDAAKAETTK